MTLREQPGVPTTFVPRASRVQAQPTPRHRVGTSHGIHPEDLPYQTDERRPSNRQSVYDDEADDDAFYETRMSTSTRRYTPAPTTERPPRTVMRVTRHQGPPPPQRASRSYAPVTDDYSEQALERPEKRRMHFLFYVGIAMVCMLMGWWLLSTLMQWWQVQQDTWRYGMPRTFQIDANVRHAGISHFTVENLHGHILVYEVQLSDLSKPHLYLGPVFSGPGIELQPATVSFEDINGDGYPDLIIAVGTGRYPLINDHSAFRPVNASDHLSGKGV